MTSLHRGLPLIALALIASCTTQTPSRRLVLTSTSPQAVDTVSKLATLPLVQGDVNGERTWFMVTESSDSADAVRRGVNWAPRLATLRGTRAVQRATLVNGQIRATGTVDFSPRREVQPSETGFPPRIATPGSRGDAEYSPLLEFPDGIVLNAAIVANASGTHDRAVLIDLGLRFATVRISRGYGSGRTAWYTSTDASDPVIAALEGATYAPRLAEAPGLAESGPTTARLGLLIVVNGPRIADDPTTRHGLQSALFGEGDPFSTLQGIPGERFYSPLWDVHMAEWTPAAVRDARRDLILGWNEAIARAEDGLLRSAGGAKANPALAGFSAAGVVVNCPVLAVF